MDAIDYSDVLQDLADRARQDRDRNGPDRSDDYPPDWDGIED